MVLMLALWLSPPGFKANLTWLQQEMALHPNDLYSATIGLIIAALLFALVFAFIDTSYWVCMRFGPCIRVFLRRMLAPVRKAADRLWEPGRQWVNTHLTHKQVESIKLGFAILVIVSGVAYSFLAPSSKPPTLLPQVGIVDIVAIAGTPVLLKMRVPLSSVELARSEAQYKGLHITKQQRDNPALPWPPQPRTTKSIIISGRAIVKQVGPYIYQVRMVP
ncbi:hypothetical protein HAP94_02065 [Acidithiobacillus ferrivorans]|nr:hypothetical protein [Acidithiobacillus ferrivorans]